MPLRGNGNKEKILKQGWLLVIALVSLRGHGNKEKILKQGWLLVIALVFYASKTRPKHI